MYKHLNQLLNEFMITLVEDLFHQWCVDFNVELFELPYYHRPITLSLLLIVKQLAHIPQNWVKRWVSNDQRTWREHFLVLCYQFLPYFNH